MGDRLAARHRELVLRQDVLRREPEESGRQDDLIERVLDASDDLLRVVDEAESRAARLRRLLATALLTAGVILAGLTVSGLLPPFVLILAGLAVGAALTLWFTAHPGRRAATAGEIPRPRPAPADEDAKELQEAE